MTTSKLVVLTTGGTIASSQAESGRHRSGALQGESLLSEVQLPDGLTPHIDVRSVLQKPSNAITLDDLLLLRKHCLALAESPEVVGIVITHGTDTLEETAYFLDITLPGDIPVVITGSQRAPHEPGTDAFRNIADAIQLAASPQARGLGTLVLFNQTLFAARQVRKVNTFQLEGFAAPETGPLGYIDGTRVHLAAKPIRARPISAPLADTLPRVDILPAYLGAAPDMIDAAIERGSQGLIIEALGRGHVPPTWPKHVAKAVANGTPIVIVSSCHRGPIEAVYEFDGSLCDLVAAGAIPLQDLSARKARLALSVLLASPTAGPLEASLKTLTSASAA
ncbi:L-asparaginase [Franzmannia pantelleriensis]|uniref:L-asparaginase n=1 Tax=Franzmannia pantelleriensis TaxID=48727 RepID=A0A1G9EGF3_9GAMM|nr:asparaginase [Halomonas pantelleriensis]SDK75168.1 L-asparaginase [Halomonas pantelleriensis]